MKNNEERGNRAKQKKKKEEQLDLSVSDYEIGFLSSLRLIVFAILVTFKRFVI